MANPLEESVAIAWREWAKEPRSEIRADRMEASCAALADAIGTTSTILRVELTRRQSSAKRGTNRHSIIRATVEHLTTINS